MKTNSPGGVAAQLNSSNRFLKKHHSLSFLPIYLLFLTGLAFQFSPLVSACQQPMIKGARSSYSKLSPELERNLRNTLKQNSLKFQLVENNGQLGLPKNVCAYFSTKSETVFVEKDRLRIVVMEPDAKSADKKDQPVDDQTGIIPRVSEKAYRYNSFSIQFRGSAGFSDCEKGNRFETKRNFINTVSGRSHVIHAASYGEITLKNIYEGIDLRLYSQEKGQLEFDWIIWPGSDPDKIRMKFEGQKNLSINANGELNIKLELGQFYMHMPESYYSTPNGKEKADYKFKLSEKNEIAFKNSKKYKDSYPLIIDPDLLWGTFFDGGMPTFDEYLYAIQYNSSNGLIYCGGSVNQQVSIAYAAALTSGYGSTFHTDSIKYGSPPGYGNVGIGQQDGLIYALTNNGQTLQYITYLGGSDSDVVMGLSLSNSFVYVCGYTKSSDFPVTKLSNGSYPAFDSIYEGNMDGYVAVLNLQLDNLVYCSYLGGPGADESLTVRAVADSSFYISINATDTFSTSTPDYLLNAADNVFGGASEAWIGKFTSFNSLNFGTYIGGSSTDLVNDFQVLSTGDVVFTGNTKTITEVNATIPSTGLGQKALFGKIHVPGAGPVSFDIIDEFGGSNNNYGWGIYSMGDSVSVIVGETNSNNFPLGSGTAFENTENGGYDGFIAKINNDGSGGYKASFTGGSDDDALVSVRPVVVNNHIALLCFGTTQSNDLATVNFNSGTFFSNSNSGGYDMMFVICDLNLTTKYYLSYIGGSDNDYLGRTGAPFGSNHLFYNAADTVLYLGTTTHSFENTQVPAFVGRGVSDTANLGVPVFDKTKGNGNNDTHLIIAISTRSLFFVLPVTWLKFESALLSDCNIQLTWETGDEGRVIQYAVERSNDGRNFETIGTVSPGNSLYHFIDRNISSSNGKVYYRIRADYIDGQKNFSTVNSLHLCNQLQGLINVYPTITSNYFTVSGTDPAIAKTIMVEMLDGSGKKIMTRKMPAVYGAQTVFFENNTARGAYIVAIKDAATGKVLKTQTIIINH